MRIWRAMYENQGWDRKKKKKGKEVVDTKLKFNWPHAPLMSGGVAERI